MSATGKTLKWGTFLTWLVGGAKALPIIAPIIIAFVILVAIILGAASHVEPIFRDSYNKSDCYFGNQEPGATQQAC